jgi:hypothetical protein
MSIFWGVIVHPAKTFDTLASEMKTMTAYQQTKTTVPIMSLATIQKIL